MSFNLSCPYSRSSPPSLFPHPGLHLNDWHPISYSKFLIFAENLVCHLHQDLHIDNIVYWKAYKHINSSYYSFFLLTENASDFFFFIFYIISASVLCFPLRSCLLLTQTFLFVSFHTRPHVGIGGFYTIFSKFSDDPFYEIQKMS